MVASPSDVQAERDTLPAVIDELNRGIAAERNLLLELHRWETDAYPGFHPDGPQGLIDPLLKIEDCDVLIGIFWRRFGTPTKDAQSGTEHEILSAYEAWSKNDRPQIMVYFNQKAYKPTSIDEADQWGRVLEFKRRFPTEGLWWEYKGRFKFERLVRNHLTQFIRQQPIENTQPTPPEVERRQAIPPGAKEGHRAPAIVSSLKKYASRLVLRHEVLAYLDTLAGRAAELPSYYPDHLRTSDAGKTSFDNVRQIVQVVKDRSAFEHWLAAELERMRAAGQDFDRTAYSPTRSLPEAMGLEETQFDRDEPPPQMPWDERAGERFKRAVILGDPGFGKTWLLHYETRRLASDAARLLRERKISLRELTLPLFARLPNLNRSDDPLEDSLVNLAGTGRSDAFRDFVLKKMKSDRCVILLDAWDEVPVERPEDDQPIAYLPHYRQRLGERLETFVRQFPLPRLLLTSRIVGYDPTHFSVPGMKELELLAFDLPQIEAFVSIWFGGNTQAAEQCMTMLRQSSQVRGLSRIPLMLTLLCRTYIECQEKRRSFPAQRHELYDYCLRGLLRDWKGEKEKRGISDAYVEAVLELLRAVGFTLFIEGYEQFGESDLREAIIKWLTGIKYKHELGEDDATSIINKLKRDGIFIAAGEQHNAPLLFLHRTFHEYLTAHALVKTVDGQREGWQAEVELRGKKILVHQLVDRKAWEPRWQEVIILLSGLLRDPAPLLKMLADKNRDDLFRHRLTLAVRCLPEINSVRRTQIAELVDEITKDAFSLWWHHQRMNTARAVHALTRALPALGQVNGRIDGMPLLERLCQYMSSENNEERTAAAVAVGEMGSATAKPEVFDALSRLLDRNLSEAVATVRKMGAAAAVPAILGKLVKLLAEMLEDPEGDEFSYYTARLEIGEPLARFMLNQDSGATATPVIFDQLAEMQQDPNSSVWNTLIIVVSEIGGVSSSAVWQAEMDSDEEISSKEVLAHLVEGLKPGGRYATMKAAKASRTENSKSVEFDYVNYVTFDNLAAMLESEAWFLRSRALRAVCKNAKAAAATPAILDQLARILQDPNSGVAVTPFVFDRLNYMLEDLNWGTSDWGGVLVTKRTLNDLIPAFKAWSVAIMAGSISDDAAVKPFRNLDELAQMLQETRDEVRTSIHWQLSNVSNYTTLLERSVATLAISIMGGAAAKSPFIDQLARLLKDSDNYDNYDVRSAAVMAVRYMGRAAAKEPILDQLARMLEDSEWLERFAAIIMMSGMGGAAGTPPILGSLSRMLQKPNWLERSAALLAVETIGDAVAAEPTIVHELARLLHDPIAEVRYAAALAISRIGSAAATPAIVDQLTRILENPILEMRAAAALAVGTITQSGVYFFGAGEEIKVQWVTDLSAI